jgi:hypothetical protein
LAAGSEVFCVFAHQPPLQDQTNSVLSSIPCCSVTVLWNCECLRENLYHVRSYLVCDDALGLCGALGGSGTLSLPEIAVWMCKLWVMIFMLLSLFPIRWSFIVISQC